MTQLTYAAITPFGAFTHVPADNGANANPAITMTPPGSMVTGQLVTVYCTIRAGSQTVTNTTSGGQTWTAHTAGGGSGFTVRLFSAIFDGTWTTDPVFTWGADDSTESCYGWVWSPSAGGTFNATPDAAVVSSFATTTANPQNSTAATIASGEASRIALFFFGASSEFRDWTMVTGGITDFGRFRNTDGSGTAIELGYLIQTSAAETGAVTNSLSGGTSGLQGSMSVAFYETITAAGEFDTNPSVATQSASAYTSITGSLDAAGDVYLVACLKDQTAPTGAQVAAGDCTGDVAAEATATASPSTGDFDFNLSLTPSNCANGSIACPVYDIYGWDGTNLVTLADEFLDPPSVFGPGSDELGQFQTLSSIGDASPAAVFTLGYDNQTANFTLLQILTDGTSGATALILDDTDSGTSGTLTLLKLSGTFGDNNEITDDWELGSGTADVMGSESYYAAANDILALCAETNPTDFTISIDAAGQVSYSGDNSRQSCLNGLLYDVSAEGFLAGSPGDIDYWNRNSVPNAPVADTIVLVIDEAISSIDLSTLFTDGDGDALTFTLNTTSPGCSTALPTGLTLMSGVLAGTPTVENETGDVHCLAGADLTTERDHWFLTLPVIDTIAFPDCTTTPLTRAACLTAIDDAFLGTITVTDSGECSESVDGDDVISTDPVASAETAPYTDADMNYSLGICGTGDGHGQNTLGLNLEL